MGKRLFQLLVGKEWEAEKRTAPRFRQELEIAVMVLIVFNVIVVIIESYKDLKAEYHGQLALFELGSVIFFSLEYLLRVWLAVYQDRLNGGTSTFKAIIRYCSTPMAIIDLLAILPFYLNFVVDLRSLRILRIMRILRILKLKRHIQSIDMIVQVFRDKWDEIGVTFFATSVLLLVAAVLMYYIEGEVQPENFPNIPATLWWAVATLTTVGYGDVFPITGMGRILSGIIAVLGIGLVALPTGILSAAFLEELQAKRKKSRKKLKKEDAVCPHCGEPLHGEGGNV